MAKNKLTINQQIKGIIRVAKLSFQVSPSAVVFKVFGAVIYAIIPIVTTYFAALTTTSLANAYNGDPNAGHQAIFYVIVTVILGLFMTVWGSIDRYIQSLVRYKIESKMSDIMYEKFLNLDFWRYDDKKTIDLYDRAQKFARFYAYIFDSLAGIFTQFITMVTGVLALILVSKWLALVIFIAIIPGMYLQFKLSRTQVAHWNKNVDVRRAKANIEWELLQPPHIAELRLYGMVKHILSLRQNLRDVDERQRLEFERVYIPKRLFNDILQTGAEVISLLWIVTQIISRQQPIGQFLYVQQIVSRAMGGANSFVSQISTIDEDIANLFDYQVFMELPNRTDGGLQLAQLPDTITVSDVYFSYPNSKKRVLNGVNLTIKKNQHIAIVGENGAGKSTLIKLLTGLYTPSKGMISIDNVNLSDINISSWHRNLAVLQQDFIRYVFATAKENVQYGNADIKFTPERIKIALEQSESLQFVDELPKGLNNYVSNWMEDDEGNKGAELSGGQWQRLALARNFYRDAPIIILDEPTSAIDALAEARIFRRLFGGRDRTIIAISHRLSTVEKADVIYVLENGKVVESGSHLELVSKKGSYYTLFEAQLHKTESDNKVNT